MVYIFGYLSLLSEESVTNTTDKKKMPRDFVPCKLFGYKRTWNSHRDTNKERYKRYVDTITLNPVENYSWSTLRKDKNSMTNGVCFKVDENSLSNMDAREVGYQRVDVTSQITSYENHALDDITAYTYIAPETNCNPSKTFIDMNYVNMGILGAERINKIAPNFLQDYVSNTEICTSTVKDLYQIFWSFDGKKLYLLNHDSTVILLHSFKNYHYFSRKGSDPHDTVKITHNKRMLDYRNALDGKSGKYSNAINSINIKELALLVSRDDYWLDLFLLRNKQLNTNDKYLIINRGNWLTQIIGKDVLKDNDIKNDHWLAELQEV